VEPDYLPDSEIFVSAVTYTLGGLHTHEDCKPFYDRRETERDGRGSYSGSAVRLYPFGFC